MRTVLQVPLDHSLRIAAEKAAIQEGFSSLQEAIRVFLQKLAQKTISVSWEPTVAISGKNERRYLKMLEDIKSGKTKTMRIENSDQLRKYLNG